MRERVGPVGVPDLLDGRAGDPGRDLGVRPRRRLRDGWRRSSVRSGCPRPAPANAGPPPRKWPVPPGSLNPTIARALTLPGSEGGWTRPRAVTTGSYGGWRRRGLRPDRRWRV